MEGEINSILAQKRLNILWWTLDANPADANHSVTHPHVQDEAVCEGEGRQPVRRALEQGRGRSRR